MVPFMPKGSTAYTFTHPKIKKDEVAIARRYTDKFGLEHKIVELDVDQYFEVMGKLMQNKGMPLSPAEPTIHILAMAAAADGHSDIVTGSGGDLKQGGYTKFRKIRRAKSFEKKLHKVYLNPQKILVNGTGVQHVLEKYSRLKFFTQLIDAESFLNEVGLEGFAHDNAIRSAGIGKISPLATVVCPYDPKKNNRLPKAFIQEFYRNIYGTLPPKKLGLQKPNFALQSYRPTRPEFRQDFDYEALDFNRKFLVFSLERFMTEVGLTTPVLGPS